MLATKKSIELLLAHEMYSSFVLDFQSKYKDCNEILINKKDELFNPKKPIIEFYIKSFIRSKFKENKSIESKDGIIKELQSFFLIESKVYIVREYSQYANTLFKFEISKCISFSKQKQNNIPNIFYSNMDYLEAMILKSAFKDEHKRMLLNYYAGKEDFNLQEAYQAVVDSEYKEQIAMLIMNDYIFEYKDNESFSRDLAVFLKAKAKIAIKHIIRGNTNTGNKIKLIKNLRKNLFI